MTVNKRFQLVASARKTGDRKGEITVYSQIGPYKWDKEDPTVTSNDFIKQLDELDVDELTVRINSPGGAVTEAIAIRTALIKHPAAKTIDIEGCCDSAATLIACLPGAHVRIAKGGEYMIHRCSGIAIGNADDMLSAYKGCMQTDKNIADIYAERTGKTAEECLKLMTAETWYGAEEAIEAGFADEIITGLEDETDIRLSACALDVDSMELMRACYVHAPEHPILDHEQRTMNDPTDHGNSEAASESPTKNQNEGVNHMELRDATVEQLQQENPTLIQEITNRALEEERKRTQRIDKLTPKGAKYAEMAKKAKADGTSVQDYLEQIIEAQDKEGEEYLEARRNETLDANNVSGGDAKDHEDREETIRKAAKDVADMAKDMSFDAMAMI